MNKDALLKEWYKMSLEARSFLALAVLRTRVSYFTDEEREVLRAVARAAGYSAKHLTTQRADIAAGREGQG